MIFLPKYVNMYTPPPPISLSVSGFCDCAYIFLNMRKFTTVR